MPPQTHHFAPDVEEFIRGRHRHEARHPSRRRARSAGGLSPWAALAIAGGAVAASALIGRRYSPDRSHPGIDRWYHELEKPGVTPPDPVFGAVWPVLEALMAVGGYRLLRAPGSPERNAAVALWLVNIAMIGGWTKIFFGERSLAGGAVGAAAMIGTGAAYVERASHVDGIAAATGVPFTAWVAFATALSEEIWRRND
jgi:tryptophan-rich sensory protein